MEQPSSRFDHLSFSVDTDYHRNALIGNILLFGTLGILLVVVGNIVGWIFHHYLAFAVVNMSIPFLIGYFAGKTALKSALVSNLRHTSIFAASSAALTAVFVATTFCSCALFLAMTTIGTYRSGAGGLLRYLDRNDISAAMLVLIMFGLMMGGIVLYAGFGALGGSIAGIRSGLGRSDMIE